MSYIFLTLIGISATLFILSFFMNDKLQQIENQVEQNSITTIQDIYQLKKKIKILEEELLTEDMYGNAEFKMPRLDERQLSLPEKIRRMNAKGMTPAQISAETSISEHDIQTLLQHHPSRKKGTIL